MTGLRLAFASTVFFCAAGCAQDSSLPPLGDLAAPWPFDHGFVPPPDLAVDLAPDRCHDGVLDGDEAAIDCGGATCQPCDVGSPCKLARDCASATCLGGTCVAARCVDGVLDGDESDVDCGGASCPACADGHPCHGAGDCRSGKCTSGFCGVPLALDFAAPRPLDTGGSAVFQLAVADLDRDGKPDLVGGCYTFARLCVLLGRGDGTFKALHTYDVAYRPYAVTVADLDGDGALDLATVDNAGKALQTLAGKGDGTFAAAVSQVPGTTSATWLASGDLDGDGRVNLVVAPGPAGGGIDAPLGIGVAKGSGQGAFGKPFFYDPIATHSAVLVADLDGDGRPDVVGSNAATSMLTVLPNAGNGTFPRVSRVDVGGASLGLAAGDLDRDGKLDLTTALFSDNQVVVLRGDGKGGFAPAVRYTAQGGNPQQVALADLDVDGHLDLVVNGNGLTFNVFRGRGDGTLLPDRTFTAGTFTWALAVVDLDLDGRPDVITGGEGSYVVMNTSK